MFVALEIAIRNATERCHERHGTRDFLAEIVLGLGVRFLSVAFAIMVACPRSQHLSLMTG
ncbi:hypothetical protein BST13_36810 [Mycobacterium aquaticum]|uniref:Uncharacterized protein n=1 Tax=Mycobacterium aquaticum TaxID=1927124 RepID=A0A1W9ZW85_9MYCO|nr:hypothetical protein BST13_36810 [Mycobacterium aquaticum]